MAGPRSLWLDAVTPWRRTVSGGTCRAPHSARDTPYADAEQRVNRLLAMHVPPTWAEIGHQRSPITDYGLVSDAMDQREAVVVAGERCTAGGGDSAEWPTSAMAAGDPRREVARADTREARSQCTRSGGGAPKRVGNAASDKVTTLNARASEPFQSPIGRRLLAATDRPPRLVARRTKRTISIRQALEARAGQRRVINRVEPPRT